jgi:hypothetical protein
MAITGKVTRDESQRLAQRHAHLTYVPFGGTEISVSQAGFGGYRVELGNGTHEQALRFALQAGINLIDTSANYTDGGSERLIGRVLAELFDGGELQRDEVVIVSKAGYLQGFNFALAEQRKQQGRPFPNLVKYAEGLDHCIHPEFIADQLTRTLERLNLETLDGYLLHNPEYYLMWAKRAHISREEARQEYYRRIRQAFEHLEEEVRDGRIQFYGVSSNTFPESAGHYTFTSLSKLWQIAQEISSNHHFRIIQLPMNLFETGAATEFNQPDRQSVLQVAHQHQLAVMVNRPLNAFRDNTLTRLAHIPMPNYPAPPEDVSTGVDSLVKQEKDFQARFLPELRIDTESKEVLREYLAIGMMLDGRWAGFGTHQNWLDLRSQFILPRTQMAVEFLSNLEFLPADGRDWLDEYVESANITLAAITAYYQEQAAKQSAQIWQAATKADPEWAAATLSQTAMRALRSTEGITTVLVGMRHQEYVQDVLADLQHPIEQKPRLQNWQQLHQHFTAH